MLGHILYSFMIAFVLCACVAEFRLGMYSNSRLDIARKDRFLWLPIIAAGVVGILVCSRSQHASGLIGSTLGVVAVGIAVWIDDCADKGLRARLAVLFEAGALLLAYLNLSVFHLLLHLRHASAVFAAPFYGMGFGFVLIADAFLQYTVISYLYDRHVPASKQSHAPVQPDTPANRLAVSLTTSMEEKLKWLFRVFGLEVALLWVLIVAISTTR